MTIPVLLVAGFLGAGKTTLVNALLRNPGGRRIAAVVNDFGAIDIDVALLDQSADGVVGLGNGCICCSLQGDLLRTLSTLMRRRPSPDAIVIEASGASDPAEIVRSLLDPVVHAETPLDTIVTVVDARHLADRPALFDDPLFRSQIAAADFCVLAKADLVEEAELDAVRASLGRLKAQRLTFDAVRGALPSSLLFSGGGHTAAATQGTPLFAAEERFETMSWTARAPLSPARFQAVIGRLAPVLLRAKGFVTFEDEPGRQLVFQLVGTRATIAPTLVPADERLAARLVLIAEAGRLDTPAATALLDAAVARSTSPDACVSTGRD